MIRLLSARGRLATLPAIPFSAGLRFTLLEAGAAPVGSWPHYSESLKLFSPARYSALPGLPFPAARPLFGTLPRHSERGEEQFTVEWHRSDDSVWYEVFAFAGPHHPLARVGYPVMRLIQKRFAADSEQSMRWAVGGEQA